MYPSTYPPSYRVNLPAACPCVRPYADHGSGRPSARLITRVEPDPADFSSNPGAAVDLTADAGIADQGGRLKAPSAPDHLLAACAVPVLNAACAALAVAAVAAVLAACAVVAVLAVLAVATALAA